ncbi:MAG: phage holin family protein [Proteobacteria bacterium]|jgi:putative membrane protein|nr:phage holin family protein [Pseudomonadota bacterium]
MIEFLAHLVISAAMLLVVANVVSGVHIDSWSSAIVGALVLGIVNAVIKPLLVLLTLPLTIVTLGLFLFVVNALVLQLVGAIAPGIKIAGFGPALLGSLLLTILNIGVNAMLGSQ